MPVSKQKTKEAMSHHDILAALKKAGHTYVSVAKDLKVHPTTVRNVAKGGEYCTSYRVAKRIAEIIDKSMHDIWPGVYLYEERESYRERCENARKRSAA